MNNNQQNKSTDYDFETARDEMNVKRNPYATSYSQDNNDNQRIRNYSTQIPSRKARKRKIKFNWGTVVFVVFIAAIIVFSIVQIKKNAANNKATDTSVEPSHSEDTLNTDTENNNPTDPIIEEEPATDTENNENKAYPVFTTVVTNDTLDEGNLVLVNYVYNYPNADDVVTLNTYNNREAPFKVAGTDIELSKVTFDAFEDMVDGLNKATGCDDVIINSGYRTLEDQLDIYNYYLEVKGEDYVKEYVAVSGYSEHHTGLACDLSFYLDEGYSEPIGEHEHGSWITENCTDYGFVVRYPADKVTITKIAHEAWHFRFVGIPHAKAMKSLNYCLEEYIDALKNYTLNTKVLYISENGKTSDISLSNFNEDNGWLVYYVPAESGNTTQIDIPGDSSTDYLISGNNTDGFIVTVTLG